jgi:hypothetical protein
MIRNLGYVWEKGNVSPDGATYTRTVKPYGTLWKALLHIKSETAWGKAANNFKHGNYYLEFKPVRLNCYLDDFKDKKFYGLPVYTDEEFWNMLEKEIYYL